MYINTDILYELLSEKYSIRRIGHISGALTLGLPQFYEKGTPMEPGSVYITRANDFPSTMNAECLLLCVGGIVPNLRSGEVFCILNDRVDILTVFNSVQKIYEKILNWKISLDKLLDDGGSISKMIEISIPIFNNRICVTDYELRILGYCESENSSQNRQIVMRNDLLRVPADFMIGFIQEFDQSILHRQPYFFQNKMGDRIYNNYCINLFLSGEYIGNCSLTEDGKEITKGEILLFQHFSEYVRRAIAEQSKQMNSSLVSIKTIFSELLQSFPVSQRSVDQALKLAMLGGNPQIQDPVWICLVIRSVNRSKNLPTEYFCAILEGLLQRSAALSYEGNMVLFVMAEGNDTACDGICQTMCPYIADMNLQVGISYSFSDIYKARTYYLQALTALESKTDRIAGFTPFSEYLLSYMLQNCCGSFSVDTLIPPGLLALRSIESNIDYWDTLRRYLDNECNASKTSEEMFLHRSSLLPRLEKIKKYVDLDTPEQRLLLRICIHTFDLLHSS